ncbi:MAG: DNA double-strand break repair nuclease NurA [Candidatus Thermoplasmatota archaeon]|nr:DNA double-strand break repair nuclease NurA [Candidatus Thermoplasmatota archaeon]
MGDLTFQKFVDFLNERRDEIISSMIIDRTSEAYGFFSKYFEKYYIDTPGGDRYTRSVAAADSSEFVRELYNGRKIILSRGYSIFESSVYASFFSEVTWVSRDDLRPLTTMIMEDCEHRSMIDMLDHERPEIILFDGSLTGRLMHGNREFRADRLDGFKEKYYSNLKALIEKAREMGSEIVFLSKSSESRSLVSKITNDSGNGQDEALRTGRIVDHVLIKSLAKSPGYSIPVNFRASGIEIRDSIWSFHLLPNLNDLPMKIDFVSSKDGYDNSILEKIVDTVFWAYAGQKVYNIWLSKVDNMVKFRSDEVERIYMRQFEKTIGIPMYETRGERRARIRI